MGMSKPVQVFRWFAVLPGAVLSAFIVMFPIHWSVMLIQVLGKYGGDSFVTIDGRNLITAIPPEMLERVAYAFSTPLALVYFGVKIAPKYKLQTGRIIAIFWAISFIAAMVFTVSQGQYFGWGWLYFVASCILGVTGVSLGLFQVHKVSSSKDPLTKG